jgi:REP element-mobilizing transposase RayT
VAACRELTESRDARILAATFMPDHVHLLFELGSRLSLDRVIAKWKTRVRRTIGAGAWQANYFEHRLRSDEEHERYAWYIFMNPYRAGLVSVDKPWPGWLPILGSSWKFLTQARPGPCPQAGWLDMFAEETNGLVTGRE